MLPLLSAAVARVRRPRSKPTREDGDVEDVAWGVQIASFTLTRLGGHVSSLREWPADGERRRWPPPTPRAKNPLVFVPRQEDHDARRLGDWASLAE